jgi:hypothetical protein
MGPMDDLVTACVVYLIGIGIVVGVVITGLVWILWSVFS